MMPSTESETPSTREFTRNVLETVRIVETREANRHSYEICATGRAVYCENTRELRVELAAFMRRFEIRGKDQLSYPGWLPHPDCVKTHVSLEEAPEASKEIFASWAEKVRKSVPSPSEWNARAVWLRASEGDEPHD